MKHENIEDIFQNEVLILNYSIRRNCYIRKLFVYKQKK